MFPSKTHAKIQTFKLGPLCNKNGLVFEEKPSHNLKKTNIPLFLEGWDCLSPDEKLTEKVEIKLSFQVWNFQLREDGLFRCWKNFQEGIETNYFWIKSRFARLFLIESLMEEIKPLVGEKNQFDYRDETTFWVHFRRFWLSRSLCQGFERKTFQMIHPTQFPLGPRSNKIRL